MFYYLPRPAIDMLVLMIITDRDNVLSAWVESPWLWHPIPFLQLAADLEYNGTNAQHDSS